MLKETFEAFISRIFSFKIHKLQDTIFYKIILYLRTRKKIDAKLQSAKSILRQHTLTKFQENPCRSQFLRNILTKEFSSFLKRRNLRNHIVTERNQNSLFPRFFLYSTERRIQWSKGHLSNSKTGEGVIVVFVIEKKKNNNLPKPHFKIWELIFLLFLKKFKIL